MYNNCYSGQCSNYPNTYNAQYTYCSPCAPGVQFPPPPCPTPCPAVSFITSATIPISIATTPIGTAPTPVPVGSTTIPVGSTIIPITGTNLVSAPEVNTGGITYTPSSGQFTVPLTGRYVVSSAFSFGETPVGFGPGQRYSYIYKVDAVTNIISEIAEDSRNAASVGTTAITVTAVLNLNAGDRVFFAAAQNTGVPLNIVPLSNPANRFSITRLC